MSGFVVFSLFSASGIDYLRRLESKIMEIDLFLCQVGC